MTETEWLACNDPQPMLDFLRVERGLVRRKAGRRKLRLFACACLQGIMPLLRQPASREAVEVAERFADGLAHSRELADASAARHQSRLTFMAGEKLHAYDLELCAYVVGNICQYLHEKR